MPPTMPYHLETGESLLALERYFNPRRRWRCITRRLDALDALRQEPPVPVDDVLRDQVAKHGPLPNNDAATLNGFADKVQKLWLGPETAANAGPPRTDRVYDWNTVPGGGWLYYSGMTERILRTTLIRGLVASMESAPTVDRVTSIHPIMFVWKCAQPWLEGWVQWRTVQRRRTVVVIMCTPGDGNHISMKPTMGYLEAGAAGASLARAQQAGFGEYANVSPTDSLYAMMRRLPRNESIVVTESSHDLTPLPASSTTTTQLAFGLTPQWIGAAALGPQAYVGAPLPWFGGEFSTTPDADVVTVSPASYDGGVV